MEAQHRAEEEAASEGKEQEPRQPHTMPTQLLSLVGQRSESRISDNPLCPHRGWIRASCDTSRTVQLPSLPLQVHRGSPLSEDLIQRARRRLRSRLCTLTHASLARLARHCCSQMLQVVKEASNESLASPPVPPRQDAAAHFLPSLVHSRAPYRPTLIGLVRPTSARPF